MVEHFLRLKLRLMANMFRRSVWQVVGMLIGALYGFTIACVAVAALVMARTIDDVDLVSNIVVVGGSIVVFGFCIAPLLFGADDTLDPRRFGLLGIENRSLTRGLFLAALIGVPSLTMAVISLSTIVTWSRDPGTTILAIVCAAAILATCVLTARVTTSIAAFLLSSRRAREFSGVIGILVIVMISPLVLLIANLDWESDGSGILGSLASWLGWTPFGAVWAAPGDAAAGAWGSALLKLLIGLATLAVLWLAWSGLVAKMLVSPQRETRAKSHIGLGWFGALPAGSTSAIAARSLTYWGRDARYWVSIVMIPVVPILMIVALTIAGVPPNNLVLLPLPIMCLFLGWAIHNDTSYDSTALWLHIASGTRGVSDRIGRIVPIVLFGIPLIAIGSIVTVSLYGDWRALPSVIGLSTAVLLVGLGLSSFSSALLPYPATHPGESPFSQPQASGSAAALVQSFSFAAIVVICAPVVVFAMLGLFVDPVWNLRALTLGCATGAIVLAAGIWSGAAVFNRRGPEILAVAIRND